MQVFVEEQSQAVCERQPPPPGPGVTPGVFFRFSQGPVVSVNSISTTSSSFCALEPSLILMSPPLGSWLQAQPLWWKSCRRKEKIIIN